MAASIRSRIVLTLVSALIVAGLVASWATYHSTRSELSGLFDEQLRHTALELIERGDNDIKHTILVGQSPEMRFLVQIYDASTNRVYLSRRTDALPLAESVGFSDIKDESGTQWRQFTATVGTKIVQVAQPMDVRDRLAVSSAMNIVQPMFILIPFLAIAIWFVIVQALQPLNKTARAVAKRSPSSMTPIDTEGLPYELKSLVDAINSLMSRLGDSLSAQQRFASDAAHELRTPLTLLQTQLELFSDEHPDILPESAEFLATLQDEVQRLSRLTHTLLDMSNLQSVPRDDVILLSPMIDEVFADLALRAERSGISLSREGEDVTVVGSDMLLCRMFFNLVENAVKYNRPGGMVKVDVQQRDGQAVIHVTDTGCGIPQEFWQSIFQPFFRVDKSLSRELGGAGLGLPLVWEIARLHAGRVWVEKSSEEGSVLTVTLPGIAQDAVPGMG